MANIPTQAPELAEPSSRWLDAAAGLVALLVGAIAFLVMLGPDLLLPGNIGWLNFADRAMHTLGWMFYRDAPWGWPPGRSPNLGIELSSSIGLVDGLPVVAMPLKLVADWLPRPFQYWGYWILLSFMLQSWFGYRVARELGAGRLLALAAAGFVLITPAFMFRVTMHMALSSHFLVLGGLLLYVRRRPPALWMWPALVTLAAGVHAYLLVMVGALWGAAIVERLWSRRATPGFIVAEIVLGLGFALGMLWVAGFFTTGSVGTYGYGSYKLNLAWPVLTYGWSQLFPDLPHMKYDYEGLSFLGLGILLLLVLALLSGAFSTLGKLWHRRWAPLLIVAAGLMVFALSKNVAWGDTDLFTFDAPGWLENIGSTLRSTGRFVWPLLYLITIGTLVLLAKRWHVLVAVPLAFGALALQAWDQSPHLLQFARSHAAPTSSWTTTMTSPFWERAVASGFNRIRAIPVNDPGPGRDWQEMGYFAVTHGLALDNVYLGRQDHAGVELLRARAAEALATGSFDARTIYILDEQSARAAAAHLGPNDLLSLIDKRYVYARDGALLVDGLGIPVQMTF